MLLLYYKSTFTTYIRNFEDIITFSYIIATFLPR